MAKPDWEVDDGVDEAGSWFELPKVIAAVREDEDRLVSEGEAVALPAGAAVGVDCPLDVRGLEVSWPPPPEVSWGLSEVTED
jgi:hypothetical protein